MGGRAPRRREGTAGRPTVSERQEGRVGSWEEKDDGEKSDVGTKSARTGRIE